MTVQRSPAVARMRVGLLLAVGAIAVGIGEYRARTAGPLAAMGAALEDVHQGVAQTMSALGRFVKTGDSKAGGERRDAWHKRVEPAIDQLRAHPPDARAARLAAVLQGSLDALAEQQWYVADVARTLGNEPARVAMTLHALPLRRSVQRLIETLTARLARRDPAYDECANQLAEFARRFRATHNRLSTFVDSGTRDDSQRYLNALTALLSAEQSLHTPAGGDAETERLLARLLAMTARYEAAAQDVVQRRRQPQANVARHRLNTAVADALHDTSKASDALRRHIRELITRRAQQARYPAWALAIALLGAALITIRSGRRQAQPESN